VPASAIPEDLEEAAALTAAYSDAPQGAPVSVIVQNQGQPRLSQLTTPAKDLFKGWLI